MTKKILAAVVAVMMVMALSVVAFANYDLTSEAAGTYDGENKLVALPEGLDLSDGATVTVHIKGHSDNAQFRLYLTNGADASGRVNEIVYVDGGDFDATVDLVIDYANGETDVAPTHLMVKGPDWQTPLSNTTIELLEIVAEGTAAPAETTPAEDTTPDETAPVEDTTPVETTPAPAETTKAPATGLAVAVVPAVVALAAVAVSKKH